MLNVLNLSITTHQPCFGGFFDSIKHGSEFCKPVTVNSSNTLHVFLCIDKKKLCLAHSLINNNRNFQFLLYWNLDYNKILGITNDTFALVTVTYLEKNLDIRKPCCGLSAHILPASSLYRGSTVYSNARMLSNQELHRMDWRSTDHVSYSPVPFFLASYLHCSVTAVYSHFISYLHC